MEFRSVRRIAPVLGLLLVACAAPIQVKRADPDHVHRVLTRNELSSGELSRPTRNLLFRYHRLEQFESDPAGALRELHEDFAADRFHPEEKAALAEAAFHYAGRGGGRPWFLASAIYAWSYLFPDDPEVALDPFSPRARLASDLYNRGLTRALETPDGEVELRGGSMPLPFGELQVDFDPQALVLGQRRLERFVPVAELEVYGFPSYYRWPGIGAPLAAAVAEDEGAGAGDRDLLSAGSRVPITALLRFEDLGGQLERGELRARLEIYPGTGERQVEIGGRAIPLEVEPTATLALMLTELQSWNTEYAGFLRGFTVGTPSSNLVSVRPYEPGRIPVVLVHGTASSSARWAEVYNELANTPDLLDHYQFWFFSYRTGNPIPYSAMLLREALAEAVSRVDPDGVDPALDRMVVVGHSQGGLLTKTTAVSSGDAFWQEVSGKPLAVLRMAPASKDLLQRSYFFEPLPFVERVIFIATPHGGSYVAGSWAAHQVARFIQLPVDLTQAFADLTVGDREAVAVQTSDSLIPLVPTSVDNMTPGNGFIRVLRELQVAPGVKAHSIIAVQGDGPLEEGDDGVVEYSSAHLPDADSEVVVPSGHSCQAHPQTIAEIRRILREHLAEETRRETMLEAAR